MKVEEVRSMKTDELHNRLGDLRRDLFMLRSQAVTEKLKDPTQLGKTRRDIARVLTVLTERGEKNIEQRQRSIEAQMVKR